MSSELFDEVRGMPDPDASRQFEELVGLDRLKKTLLKEARLLLVPGLLERWSREKHGTVLPCVKQLHMRAPVMVFSGDVGTGKTTLADSLGDQIARAEGIKVTLLRLSLITRGAGAVGQMTRLISQAFGEVAELARPGYGSGERPASAGRPLQDYPRSFQQGRGSGKRLSSDLQRPREHPLPFQRGRGSGKKPASAVVFVIDEADALAESRATGQMHHEDRAGVNALIRGIDRLARERLPVLVILCTNRLESLDPAVLRRAAIQHEFGRPTVKQVEALLRRAFGDTFDDGRYGELSRRAGPDENGRGYGYSFSDITQRLIPNVLLEAFPDRPVDFELVLSVLDRTEPTKPFGRAAE